MKAQQLTDYDKQAIDFLESTGTELKVQYLYTGTYFPDDTEERDIYSFTLTNGRGSYSAKFGDSLQNTLIRQYKSGQKKLAYKEDYDFCKRHKIGVSPGGYVYRQKTDKPSAYDILACLDSYCPDTFEEFCDEYEYSDSPLTDYDKVMSIYLSVREQARGLKAIFSEAELEQLAEIA